MRAHGLENPFENKSRFWESVCTFLDGAGNVIGANHFTLSRQLAFIRRSRRAACVLFLFIRINVTARPIKWQFFFFVFWSLSRLAWKSCYISTKIVPSLVYTCLSWFSKGETKETAQPTKLTRDSRRRRKKKPRVRNKTSQNLCVCAKLRKHVYSRHEHAYVWVQWASFQGKNPYFCAASVLKNCESLFKLLFFGLVIILLNEQTKIVCRSIYHWMNSIFKHWFILIFYYLSLIKCRFINTSSNIRIVREHDLTSTVQWIWSICSSF